MSELKLHFLAAAWNERAILWIVLLPLLGAIANGFFGKILGRKIVYIVGVASVAVPFLFSVAVFYSLVKMGAHHAVAGAEGEAHAPSQVAFTAWDWFRAPIAGSGAVQLKIRWVVDSLSGVMLLVVTGVGSLIHLYSAGYMAHDEGYARYFAFLNLFVFSMLNLILGDSLVLLFAGWEGVGLCSYLLIGFWFTNSQYASAGRKAFIVNRIGDVGFILGMTILAWKVGAYEFSSLRAAIDTENSPAMIELARRPELDDFISHVLSFGNVKIHDFLYRLIPSFSWGGLACFFLFIGCAGKSAQLPLYVWLPDAMAGPTPVSALIHAATMVTAGIYLLCRMSFVFVSFPKVMAIIAIVGALTAFFSATIALAQNELKKVLAYSTVSQLGFMFIGCGVGAFSAGFFHVFTHAMFKACLFLGAGAVMHACRDKQDIRELGGLRKYLKYTYPTFAIATLAIIGFPGFSGFFSKDEILFRALASHNTSIPWSGKFVFGLGVVTAALTAFYMCRLLFVTFWGEFKGWSLEKPADAVEEDEHEHEHEHEHGHGHGKAWDPPKENDWPITAPLVVLAGLSIVAGYIGIPYLFTGHVGLLPGFLHGVVRDVHINHVTARGSEVLAMTLGSVAFLAGSGLAYFVYIMRDGEPARMAARSAPWLYRLVSDKWRVDELYDVIIVGPVRTVSNIAASFFDRWIIDGLVKLIGLIPRALGALLRMLQTGSVQTYGATLSIGLMAILGWAMMRPSAVVSARAEGTRLTLQAYGGPGYAYEWDLRGDGTFAAATAETRQQTTCAPIELADGRRVCRVGLRVRNSFGFTSRTIRTVEIATPEPTEGRR